MRPDNYFAGGIFSELLMSLKYCDIIVPSHTPTYVTLSLHPILTYIKRVCASTSANHTIPCSHLYLQYVEPATACIIICWPSWAPIQFVISYLFMNSSAICLHSTLVLGRRNHSECKILL